MLWDDLNVIEIVMGYFFESCFLLIGVYVEKFWIVVFMLWE